jgi:opacity protein-like surface antigen
MKLVYYLFTLLVLALISVPVYAEEVSIHPYLGVELGRTRIDLDSGGFNTLGPHENTNDDNDAERAFGIKAGLEYGRWRAELSYIDRRNFEFTTDSFRPPTPTFFYDSEVRADSLMLSGYYTFFKHEKIAFYGGGGIGGTKVKIDVTDGVAEGDDRNTNFTWQVEGGAEIELTENWIMQAGWRYIDMGDIDVDLASVGGVVPGGNYDADLTATEVFLGLRYRF